ncbi:hypothetical protein [Clostridium weizhouense]|uniref:Uncharacterized protein n=1 Tax=Clostridium weizhouense TaxID=2859781 RepID=A0ABS7ATB3_9CLOT|nr:hypothetical protein [Clostridium weizhouense]MBW6411328.1 hypothetical protein [Clostridium weizhouense]
MIEIAYLREDGVLKTMPQEVQEKIKETLQILDSEYGYNRDKYKDNGGYVIVVDKQEDFRQIKKKTYIDCNTVIAEYVDKIVCSNSEVYTNSLILCNNDYAISLIIPLELTPENLRNYIID